jgi:xanthine dehydrogenase YagS FAD-binding subunit
MWSAATIADTSASSRPASRAVSAGARIKAARLSGASAQLRNAATVGGNLLQRTRCAYFYDPASACNKRQPGTGCDARGGENRLHAVLGWSESCIATHPSDFCVPLAALDAVVEIEGQAVQRQVALEDFHLLPGTTPERESVLAPGELESGKRPRISASPFCPYKPLKMCVYGMRTS